MKTKQKGFTIIELVVVILLLGILTATALPRFMDVTEQAHTAAVDGVEAGLATGLALFRAQWVAEGQGIAGLDEFDNLLPSLPAAAGQGGFPTELTGGDNIADSHADCVAIFEGLLQPGGRPSVVASTGTAGAAIAQADVNTAAGNDYLAALTDSTANNETCTYAYLLDDTDITGTAATAVRGITLNTQTGVVTRTEI